MSKKSKFSTVEKIISLFLSFVMVFGVFFIVPMESVGAYTSHSRDEAVAWARSKIGSYIDLDGYPASNPYQCVDLIKAYYQYLGVSSVSGNGCDYSHNSLPSGWTRIQNTPTFVPEPGDIVVWTDGGWKNGHVAIFLSGDTHSFTSIDQNWPQGSAVKEVSHNYNYVWGVVRPDFQEAHNPIGYFDGAESTAPGQLHISGWAFDYDNVNVALDIHVYVGGAPGTGAPCYVISANKYRPDVNGTFSGIGEYHGFDDTITVDRTGNQEIHVYAINVGGGTDNPELDQSPKTVNIQSIPTNYQDIGADFYGTIITGQSKLVSVDTSGNVVQMDIKDSRNQIWHFVRSSDLSYTITNLENGKCLDVYGKGTTNETNVFSCESNGGDNQKWYFIKQDGDNYSLIPKHARGMALDVPGASAAHGTNIQIYEINNSQAQKFRPYKFSTYTISYNMNGGSGSIPNQLKVHGQYIILSDTRPTRTGYEFIGWSTNQNSTTAQYQSGDKYYGENTNHSLYAVWKSNTYVDIGTDFYGTLINYGASKLVSADSNYNVVQMDIKDSRNQIWYFVRNNDLSYTITNLEYGSCLDVTGTSNYANVQIYPNYNGDNQRWYFTIDGDRYILHPKNAPTMALDVADGSTAHGANIQILETNYSNAQGFLPCQFNTYTISYNMNGGSGSIPNQLKVHGQYIILSDTRPTRTGYEFIGWSTNQNSTTAQYQPGDKYYGENTNHSLYAVWKANTYTIAYDTNGGSGSIDNQIKTYGQDLTLSDVKPTKTGYEFLGWSTDQNAATEQYQPNSMYKENKDVILYAVWKANTKIALNKTALELGIGANETLTAVLTPKNDSMTVNWKSSNTKIATVDKNGIVTSVSKGTATITASLSNGEKATCTVTVKKYPDSISLNKTSVVLGVGQTCTLNTTITPVDAETTYSWSSTDKTVATVNSNGKITARKVGTAVIKVKTVNGQIASCKVTVRPAPESVALNKTSAVMGVKQTCTLTAALTPSNSATYCTWTSSNKAIATVTSAGKVTAKKVGKVTITVKTSNGKTATCTITVKKAPDSITLNKTSATIGVKQTCNLTATLSPDNSATYCSWSSSDKAIATVTSTGRVTAKKVGTVTIMVKTSNGKTATCIITVKKAPDSVTLNKTATTIKVGQTETLKAALTPSNSVTYCNWSSSDKTIATVSADGVVTAKKAGAVTIMVKTSNGKVAVCTVTVKK